MTARDRAPSSGAMGFTTNRPPNYPAIDRSALMRDAHRIAKASLSHFDGYRAAFSYGLRAAWMAAKSRQTIRALAEQAGQPATPFTAAQIAASRAATLRCGASLWAS
jgi:hypothetical protein